MQSLTLVLTLTLTLPLTLTLTVYPVGDRINQGVYHVMIHNKGFPLLEPEAT